MAMPRRQIDVDSDNDIDDFPSLQRSLPSSTLTYKPSSLGTPQARAVARTPKPSRLQTTDAPSAAVPKTATRRRKLGKISNDASLLRPLGDRVRGTPAGKHGNITPTEEIDLPFNTSPEPRRPKQNRPRIELRTRRSRRVSDIPADESGELSTEEASVLEDVTLDEDIDEEEEIVIPSGRKRKSKAAVPRYSGVDVTKNDKGDTANAIDAARSGDVDDSAVSDTGSGTRTGTESDTEAGTESEASEFQDLSVSDSEFSAGSLDDLFARSPPKRKPAVSIATRGIIAAPAQPRSLPGMCTDEDSSVFFSADESFHNQLSNTATAGTRRGSRSTTPPDETSDLTSSKSSGLVSPTKKLPRIPQTQHRPSTDAFWNQAVVDDWNMEHSPRKLLFDPDAVKNNKKNPTKSFVRAGRNAGAASGAGALSGGTVAVSPPLKKTTSASAKEKEAKKKFQKAKHEMAESFLLELDAVITKGELGQLASATGGIRIEWTNRLNTTAGRANWRRETLRPKASNAIVIDIDDSTASAANQASAAPATRVLHHASIQLAEKVIDDEHRLLNVIAHEFCHLANFMISGITGNPHGKEFKAWAAQCSRHFGDRGIQVTTKHAYEIDFKYVWTCEACATEFKRHSKSIDPSRHRCGACKGMLKQTKPTPRGVGTRATAADAAGTGSRPAAIPKPSEYQKFMKEHMATVRQENPGSPQRDIMRLVADKWTRAKQLKLSGLRPEVQPDKAEDIAAQMKGRESSIGQLGRALDDLTLG